MKYYYLKRKINDYNSKYEEISSDILITKKSKFISYIFKIDNENDAKKYIESIAKENTQARHIVYIYSYIDNTLPIIRYSDDGEPNGTGTKSIYEMLEKENITNICIVIVRYFGGILLGVGPLARAYLNCAKNAILNCDKKEIYEYINLDLNISYSNYESIKSLLNNYKKEEKIKIKSIIFDDIVKLSLEVDSNDNTDITKILTLK